MDGAGPLPLNLKTLKKSHAFFELKITKDLLKLSMSFRRVISQFSVLGDGESSLNFDIFFRDFS